MKKAIFDFQNYRDYLEAYMHAQPNGGRGFRSSLAQALKCQNSHITQVLAGQIDLSLERADLLNRFMNHTQEESDFLILQVEHSRAGSASLKSYFAKKLADSKKKRDLLRNRLPVEESIGLDQKKRYYGSWAYAAIHILVGIPEYRTLPSISTRLGIDEEFAKEILDDLARMQLIIADGHEYLPSAKRIYLGADSTLVRQHHANWRVRSLLSLETPKLQAERDFHFSSVVSVSQRDFLLIKEELMTLLGRLLEEIVRPSNEETLVSLCLDWFEVRAQE